MKHKRKYCLFIFYLCVILSTFMLSCQSSCASDKTGISERVQTTKSDKPSNISDITIADFEALTKVLYDFLKTGKFNKKSVPNAVTSVKQQLKVILTISTNKEPAKKYIFELVSGIPLPIHEINSLSLPIDGKFTLRTDYILSEDDIARFDSRFQIDFLNEYFCLTSYP